MASLGNKFDSTAHDTEQKEFELLPDMIARLEVISSDVKADDDGKGTTLALAYGVIEPEEYKNQRFFSWITLENSDASKQERGQRELASLCRAVGLVEISDSEELHFQAFTAKVKKGTAGVSKAGKPYKARNSIGRFYFPDSDDMPEIGVTGPAIPAPKPANDNTPPRGDARTTGNGGAAATGKARPWGKKAA